MHGKGGTEAEVKAETFSTQGSPQPLHRLCLGAPGWALTAAVGSARPPLDANTRVQGGAGGEAGTEAGTWCWWQHQAWHSVLLVGQGWGCKLLAGGQTPHGEPAVVLRAQRVVCTQGWGFLQPRCRAERGSVPGSSRSSCEISVINVAGTSTTQPCQRGFLLA